MNVAFEDPFIVIGSNPIIKVSDNVKYIEVAQVLSCYATSLNNRTPSKPCTPKERYEIAMAYVKNEKSKIAHEGKVITVKRFQDVKPLQLRLYCELDWEGK